MNTTVECPLCPRGFRWGTFLTHGIDGHDDQLFMFPLFGRPDTSRPYFLDVVWEANRVMP